MTPLARARAFAESASPRRLAVTLALVLAAFLVNALANGPVEEALRPQGCTLADCLRPLRPDARHQGYTAAEFRAYLAAIGPARRAALWALLADLPLIAASVAALLTMAGLVMGGPFLSDRSRRLLIALPLAYAAADLAENGLLALAYAGLADVAAMLPWASALKFGLLAASAILSLFLGLVHALRA